MSSTHSTELQADMISPRTTAKPALIAGVIGIVSLLASLGLLFGGFADARQFAFSWLFAVVYFFLLAVGALFWVLVHYATDAQWSVLVRRQIENVGALLPAIMIFFFAGIIFLAPHLFKWWHLQPGEDPIYDHKAGYLNHTGFYIRAVLYFVGLSLLACLSRRNSIRQDNDGRAIHTVRNRKLAFIGIPVLGLSTTFAAVDWIMALEHHWFSTMWGVYLFAGSAGAALCLLVLIVTALKKAGHLELVNDEHYHILGKLMLAFCIFWAYIGFSQYMLIWYANLPEETSYYIRRTTESWWDASLLLVIGRFFIPFVFLLFQATKKHKAIICTIAAWMLFMQALDLYTMILPILHQKGIDFSLLDITLPVGIGGVLVALFLRSLSKQSLYPLRDPRINESIHLSN